jgi:hypothetical protein
VEIDMTKINDRKPPTAIELLDLNEAMAEAAAAKVDQHLDGTVDHAELSTDEIGGVFDQWSRNRAERSIAALNKADDDAETSTKFDKLLECMDSLIKRMDTIESDRKAEREKADADAKAKSEADREAEMNRDKGEPKQVAADDVGQIQAALADAQARADSISHAFGEQCPPPLSGEGLLAYRRRLLRQFQRFSPDFEKVDLSKVTDSAMFDGIEKRIFADAIVAAQSPSALPGQLRMITKIDPTTGQRINTFVGSTTFISQMKPASRRVAYIGERRHAG